MKIDETEMIRRKRMAELNQAAAARAELEKRHGKVWDSAQLRVEFEIIGFMAPFVVVKKIAGGEKGSLEFQHDPRFYFNYKADRP
jgi:hypothetical protein